MSLHPLCESAMLRSVRLACISLLCLPTFAFAQADDTTVPPPTCVKPVLPAAGTALSKTAADKLNAESTAYSACAQAYIAARRTTAAKHQAIATTQANAANTFVAEFNGFVASLDAFSKAQAAKK